jgi:propanol-preferring alcohol dehydrogenase
MQAMVFREAHGALHAEERSAPVPTDHEVLIKVHACAVCRTDLHVQDAELPGIPYPIVPGHQVVGEVVAAGENAVLPVGRRVGAAWLGWTCGECEFCVSGRENLCDRARFHGYHLDGGFAEAMLADSRYCLSLDSKLSAAEIAPLLCAGLIGYRSLRLAGPARQIGIYGFGSAAHIVTQVARREGADIYAFTRPGDRTAQNFALELGAAWAGGSDSPAPVALDAAIIFAPDGSLVPKALKDIRKGGCVVCGGIHMSDIPSFPYADLWGERSVRSVANLTRQDGADFMAIVNQDFLQPRVTTYKLHAANAALEDLRNGSVNGSAVLVMD